MSQEPQKLIASESNSKQKINWEVLKMEYMSGPFKTAKEFLKSKNMDINHPYYAIRTSGWATEKKKKLSNVYQRVIERSFKKEEDRILEATQRHAAVAQYMQSKGEEALRVMPVEDVEQARKLIISGIDKERQALGVETEQKKEIQNLTQVNLNFPNTKLDEMLEGLDYEGTLRLIAEVRRRRAVGPGKETIIEGETETK